MSRAPVAVKVGQGDGQRHRPASHAHVLEVEGGKRKPAALSAGAEIGVVEHAAQPGPGVRVGAGGAAQEQLAALDLIQLLIVGGAHQVQVAVAVQVRPGHGVNRKAGGEAPILYPGEGPGRAAPAQPPRLPVAAGHRQVQVAVAVHVHRVDRAGLLLGQRQRRELKVPAAVPEHGHRRAQPGQRDVDPAVAVKVGQRHPGAVAVERLGRPVAGGGVGEQTAHEAPGTGAGVELAQYAGGGGDRRGLRRLGAKAAAAGQQQPADRKPKPPPAPREVTRPQAAG